MEGAVLKELEKLSLRRLVIIVVAMYYPLPVRASEVKNIINSIKPTGTYSVYRALHEMKTYGKLTQPARGWYQLSPSGLKYYRWLWLHGYVPNEVINPIVHSIKIVETVREPKGSFRKIVR